MTRKQWRLIFYANAVFALTNAVLFMRPGANWLSALAAIIGAFGVWRAWPYV